MSSEKMSKETALNLLEDLLTLCIRTFSYFKQKQENVKLEAKKQKMNSLRKGIKKSSLSLCQGHYRRGAVVKGVEHISTIVLVNIRVARVRVPLVLSVGI